MLQPTAGHPLFDAYIGTPDPLANDSQNSITYGDLPGDAELRLQCDTGIKQQFVEFRPGSYTGLIPQRPSRTIVQSCSYDIALGLSVPQEVSALRKVLTQKSIHVLVASPLPRRMQITKIHRSPVFTERGNSLLKTTFKALRNVSLCLRRIGTIVAAALVILHVDHDRTT